MALRRQWLHNGCLGRVAALPSLAHLLRCSWFNRQEAPPEIPAPSRKRFLPALPRLSPCAGRGRPSGAQTLGHLLKKQNREKWSKSGPHAESQLDGWKKKRTGQVYWNVAPEGHRSSVQNTGGTFSSNRAQDTRQASCGGFESGLLNQACIPPRNQVTLLGRWNLLRFFLKSSDVNYNRWEKNPLPNTLPAFSTTTLS